MRIAFAGTPPFAAVTLTEMLRRNHEVVSVLTQPDTSSGRGLRLNQSAVKQLALARNIAVQQPATLKDGAAVAALEALRLDVLIVVAYGLILPESVLALPRLGCLNVHASLLPRWRGAAPIQRAIMAGDAETGVCVMRMDEGLDTGPVYDCRSTPIHPDDTSGTLHDRLAAMGATALCDVLAGLAQGRNAPQPQSREGVTYAAKILKQDCRVDWTLPAVQIERLLRALDPSHGAQTTVAQQNVKLWHGQVLGGTDRQPPPGAVVAIGPDGIDVQCGDGVLRLTELQRAGGRRMSAVEFLRGFRLAVGDRFGD